MLRGVGLWERSGGGEDDVTSNVEPIPDAPAIYAWVREGTPVDVYDEYGGGSARVRDDAGP